MDIRFQVDSAPVLGPVLVLFAVAVVVRVRRGRWSRYHALLQLAAGVYLSAVLSLTVFPLNVTWGMYANQASWVGQINFIPLLTADLTFIPNVMLLVPAGFLLPLLFRHADSPARAALITATVSLALEAGQLLSYLVLNNGRSVDVNDVLANTLGGLAGYALARLALKAPSLRAPLLAAARPGSAALREEHRRTTAGDTPPPASIADPVVRP
ncbi:VanZ family protein [Streptomyces sp. NPDC002125]